MDNRERICTVLVLVGVVLFTRSVGYSEEWAITYGGHNHGGAACIQQTISGGYIVTGYTTSFDPGFSIGQYAVYMKNIHYQDVDNSNTYSQGDLVEEIMPWGLAIYVIDPGQVERSHYCAGGNLVTSVIRIYGWGFGETQGDGKVYIGTGGMWSSDTGLELERTIWSNLMIKAAVDLPLGARGMTLYIWVEKDGAKTDDKYGYPGLYILPTETCP